MFYATTKGIVSIRKMSQIEYKSIIHALENIQWYHYTMCGMVIGGSEFNPKFEAYIKWSDVQKNH